MCRFLVVGNIFRHETCMNGLVKIPPYSKLEFQANMFFTQNRCNNTLSSRIHVIIYYYAFAYFLPISVCYIQSLAPQQTVVQITRMCVLQLPKEFSYKFQLPRVKSYAIGIGHGMYR